MGEMRPVGGNWCWISNRADLRYTMAHGWRICVIFGTVAIYLYIRFYLKRKLRCDTPESNRIASLSLKRQKRKGFQVMDDEGLELDAFGRSEQNAKAMKAAALGRHEPLVSPRHTGLDDLESGLEKGAEAESSTARRGTIRHRPTSSKVGVDSLITAVDDTPAEGPRATPSQDGEQPQVNVLQTNGSEFRMRPDNHQVELEVKRMLLLNAYPFMYVILWAPGLINRVMEASGHSNSVAINAALQAPSQFIGLANALTYGFNHHLRDRLNDLYIRPIITRIKNRVGL
ncbi:cyclic amp receptor 2 [Fusarium heterosporum]|uniref:Cyclic amp receptor 2 n=1 Tax=Fusarium heterosporum TaxID=42747 RepID=A0A8H5U442_FUSHE|nr:cyclic amp receptor 2 [Fusarium heterosporum]